jgi:PIN domain nuclease of toxin-antitoxin system
LKLLLDTHLALWAITDSPRLSAPARALISDLTNELYVSIASLWEIAIKHALGPKRRHPIEVDSLTAQQRFQSSGYAILPITVSHIHALAALPLIHGDPFDRLLVAQGYETPLRLVTQNATLQRYGDFVISV